jgi:large subunit ribosomal protein L21
MYAVLRTGGKQYRVEAGTTFVVEKLAGEPGSTVTFDRVLLVGDGDDVTVGTPTVAGATVSATVIGQVRGEKIVVFKFKQKAKYRRRTGHRQQLTQLRVDEITAGGRTVRAAVAEVTVAEPAKAKARAKPKVATPVAEAEEPTVEAAEAQKASAPKPTPKPRRRAQTSVSAEAGAPGKAAAAADEPAPAPAKPRARRAPKPRPAASDETAAEE